MPAESSFVASRKQLRRMAVIVATLKKGDCRMADIQDEIDKATRRDGSSLNCSERTIRSDMDILRREFRCPLEYNQSEHRYVLYDKSWEFSTPSVLNTSELLAVIIGGKLSRDILSPSISRRVENAVNEVIRSNQTDNMIASGRIGALRIIAHAGDTISDEVFSSVFDAWRDCHRLFIEYNDSKDRHASRRIEPHALVFYDMQWSIRARAFRDDGSTGIRTYLVSRITRAYVLEEKFVPDEAVMKTAVSDNYYMFREAGGVRIRLNRRGAQYARAHRLRTTQVLTQSGEDEFYLAVPSVSVEEMLQWTLANVPGDAIPVEPPEMVDAFKKALDTMKSLCP